MGRTAFATAADELAHLSRNQAQVVVKHAKRSLTEILKRNPHLWENPTMKPKPLAIQQQVFSKYMIINKYNKKKGMVVARPHSID